MRDCRRNRKRSWVSLKRNSPFLLQVFAALLTNMSLHAAPVRSSASAGVVLEGIFSPSARPMDFRTGYEGDFVTDARMEQKVQGQGRVDTYQQSTNSGVGTLNVLDRVDLFGVFGSSRTEADWRFGDVSAGTVTRIEVQTKYGFLWGGGGRAILYKGDRAFFGVGGRYSTCNYDPNWLTSDGVIVNNPGAHFRWQEWQISADIAYKIGFFTPYLGAKYLNVKTYLKDFEATISANGTGVNTFENRIPVGVYVGVNLSNGQYFMLNLEGRLVDEEAITVAGDFRF